MYDIISSHSDYLYYYYYMLVGFVFACMAGLLWGLIFITPLLIPEYPSTLQAAGRYIAFGLVSLPISWYNRNSLRKLLKKDWIEAVKLVFVGNLIYYICLTAAIQNAGAPISTMIIGILPIAITISYNFTYSNNHTHKLSNRFWFVILLTSIGLISVNISEVTHMSKIINFWSYVKGILLAIISVICWTWYALRNSYWLKKYPYNKPATWATAQGIVLLPLSLIIYIIFCYFFGSINNNFILPFGPRPQLFLLLMISVGILCSWLGTFCWNIASQRLPTIFIGPLISLETLAGLLYTFIHRQIWPSTLTLFGILCLITGILYMYKIEHT